MPPKKRVTASKKAIPEACQRTEQQNGTSSTSESESESDGGYDDVQRDEAREIRGQLEQGEVVDSSDGGEGDVEEREGLDPMARMVTTLQRQHKEMQSRMMELVNHAEAEGQAHSWKKDGLKRQFEIASNVVVKMTTARAALTTRQYQRADVLMEEGLKILQERIKELKIADASEAGWETVNVYRSHPLADNAADDKKIRRAERIAKERLAARSRKPRPSREPYQRRYDNWQNRDGYNRENRSFRSTGSMKSQDQYQRNGYTPQRRDNYQADPKRSICFYCGQEGHWQNACPRKNAARRER